MTAFRHRHAPEPFKIVITMSDSAWEPADPARICAARTPCVTVLSDEVPHRNTWKVSGRLARRLRDGTAAEISRMRHRARPGSETPNTSAGRSTRIEVMGQLHGQLVPMNVPLDVRDLSSGGFAVESSVDFPVGAVHRFRFVTQNGIEVLVRANARHCRSIESSDGAPRFLAGFAFIMDPNGETEAAVEILLRAATSALVLH